MNVSQYVLVRIPYNMGLFEKDAKHALKVGIRRKLSMKIANDFNDLAHLQPLLLKLKESERTDE